MAAARPLSDLPKFLGAVAGQSKEAAADASNAAALLLVRGLRAELPTRRLNAGAILGRRSEGGFVYSYGKQTGKGVNYAYLESDASKAKFQPTAAVIGRGPVHLLENPIKGHFMTRGVVRRAAGGRGKPPTIRDIVPGRGVSSVSRGGRKRSGPTLLETGDFRTSAIRTYHPGVKRTSGPFKRGIAKHGSNSMKRWQTTFVKRSTEVKF